MKNKPHTQEQYEKAPSEDFSRKPELSCVLTKGI